MKKTTAIDYFGSVSALAEALSISQEAVSQWGENVPELRAYQLERITNGALTVDDNQYSKPKAGEAA